jgi:beta-phosphoglucomutase
MKIKGVIFDLDGVLISTDEYHYQAWKILCDSYGIPFDHKENDLLRGVSRMDSLGIILKTVKLSFPLEMREKMAEEKNDIYRKLLSQNVTSKSVSAETRKVLDDLRMKNIEIGLGSSSKNAKTIISLADLERYFDAIVDGNMITHSKPNPEVFLNVANLLKLKPGECLVVEDAVAGIQAAHNGGFHSYAIKSARNSPLAEYKSLSLLSILKIVLD